MEMLRFLLGAEQLPVYRTVTEHESEMLRALLGSGFYFELEDGEPLDGLLFDARSGVAMRAQVYFALPPGAFVLGTFELRDSEQRGDGEALEWPRPAGSELTH